MEKMKVEFEGSDNFMSAYAFFQNNGVNPPIFFLNSV